MDIKQSEASAIIGALKDVQQPTITYLQHDGIGAPVIFAPAGMVAHDARKMLDRFRATPERPRGTVRCESLESFVTVCARHADDGSAIFASLTGRRLLAVFDYHRPSFTPPTDGAAGIMQPSADRARWLEHRAVYEFPTDPAWDAWIKADGKPLNQRQFAELLELRADDVADPAAVQDGAPARFGRRFTYATPLQVEELARGLDVRVDGRVVQSVSLSSGEASLTYETSHKDSNGNALRIPGAILLELSPFRGGTVYQIPVRLRYAADLVKGAITWTVHLQAAEQVIERALKDAFAFAQERTALPLYLGEPEAIHGG